MLKEEIKCLIIVCLIALITICLVLPFGNPSYLFLEYFPYNIVLVLLILFVDVILSFYVVMKTRKNIKVINK